MSKNLHSRFIAMSLLVLALAPVGSRGESLPDPTRPADYTERTAIRAELPQEFINWNVRAIKSSASGRNAIVNGRLVKVGDQIDSATIIDITPDSVVLDHGRKQLVLRLMPEDIKKKRTDAMTQSSE